VGLTLGKQVLYGFSHYASRNAWVGSVVVWNTYLACVRLWDKPQYVPPPKKPYSGNTVYFVKTNKIKHEENKYR
jgi:hypothetical protein